MIAFDLRIGGEASPVSIAAVRLAPSLARAFETGNISINSGSSVHLEAPFGGVKQSGIGRELGLAALDAYTEWKTVYVDIDR